MQINRRDFIRLSGVAGLAALNAAAFGTTLAQDTPTFDERDVIFHAITRLTFGVTPELYDEVAAMGVQAFIEQQLAPETLDDAAVEAMLAQFPAIGQSAAQLYSRYADQMTRQPSRQLVTATILRAVYSRRQLYERMVGFWSDHFNIYLVNGARGFLKVVDDREVIRQYALGSFRDLLGASAHSPAMLLYLDNHQSRAEHPNENYARELLELHTLGVNGGYTEDDVKEVARAFTGWSFVPLREDADQGMFIFRAPRHDDGNKTVLGVALPDGQGEQDGEQVLDLLAAHPSTARFIATKLARRFVADVPSASLVEQIAMTFTQTNGDIRETLRMIFNSEAFRNAPPKLKRPFDYTVSVIRALGGQLGEDAGNFLYRALQTMGHVPFAWPAPNGYPDISAYWSSNLLPRWNFAIEAVTRERLVGGAARLLDNVTDLDAALRQYGEYLYGRALTDAEFTTARDFALATGDNLRGQARSGLALLMAAPGFQYA
jgi:uncharacterized protein (DUF1800 family)